MKKMDFYIEYESEHQKVEKVVNEWDCSAVINSVNASVESLRKCIIDCSDTIGINWESSKIDFLNDVNNKFNLLKGYDSCLFDMYSLLLERINLLENYNNDLQNVYGQRPKYPSAYEIAESPSAISNYNAKKRAWEDCVNNLEVACSFIVDDIENVKKEIKEFYNEWDFTDFFMINRSSFLKRGFAIDSIAFRIDYVPINFKEMVAKRFGIKNPNYDFNVDFEIVDINGVNVKVYKIKQIHTSQGPYDNYISKSIEYMKLIPVDVLKSITSQGSNIVYVDNIKSAFMNENIAGFYSLIRKDIVIGAPLGYVISDCILHECGHAFDNYLGTKLIGKNCLYTQEKGFGTGIHLVSDFPNDLVYLDSINHSGYNVSDFIEQPYECFADAFNAYCLDNDCFNNTLLLGDSVTHMLELLD